MQQEKQERRNSSPEFIDRIDLNSSEEEVGESENSSEDIFQLMQDLDQGVKRLKNNSTENTAEDEVIDLDIDIEDEKLHKSFYSKELQNAIKVKPGNLKDHLSNQNSLPPILSQENMNSDYNIYRELSSSELYSSNEIHNNIIQNSPPLDRNDQKNQDFLFDSAKLKNRKDTKKLIKSPLYNDKNSKKKNQPAFKIAEDHKSFHNVSNMRDAGKNSLGQPIFQIIEEFDSNPNNLVIPRPQESDTRFDQVNLDEINLENFSNVRPDTNKMVRVIDAKKIGLNKDEARAAWLWEEEEMKFRFELRAQDFLDFQLLRNKYKGNKIYPLSTIRMRLFEITNTIENYIILKKGNGKLLGLASYGIGLLSLAATSVVQEQIKSKLCPDSLGNKKQEKCLENFRVLSILTTAYTGLFFLSITTYNYGAKWLESAKSYDNLYDRYAYILHALGFNTQDHITQEQINNKRDFADYICIKFWEELIIDKGYENDVKGFFRKHRADKIVDVHLNIKIAIYEYLSKVHEKWHNENKLQEIIKGREGQKLAETIVDTVVKGYSSNKKFHNFNTIFKIDELLRLLESVLKCGVLPKGELVSDTVIEHASLNNSGSTSDVYNLDQKIDTKDKIATSGKAIILEKQKLVPALHKFYNRNRITTNSIENSIVNSAGTYNPNMPLSTGQSPLKLETIKENNSEDNDNINIVINKQEIPTIEDNNTLKEKVIEKETKQQVMIEEKAELKISLEDEDSGVIFADSTEKYLRDCFAKTVEEKGAADTIRNILFNIFEETENTKQDLINNIDLHAVTKQILESIKNRSLRGDFWLKTSEVMQSFFGSIPFVALAQSKSLTPYAKLLISGAGLIMTAVLQIPKNGLEKEKSYAKSLFEKFDEAIRKMLHTWLININETTNVYNSDVNLTHMQLICITTSAMIALHNNKYTHEKHMQINSNDLAYLNMQLLYSFTLMYNEKGRFQLKEMPQVHFIISCLYKELNNKFESGFVNWRRGRSKDDLSIASGTSSDSICLILKKSIFYSSASPELVNLKNMLKLRLLKDEKIEIKKALYINEMVFGVYDYKMSRRITQLDVNAINICASALLIYYKKNNPKNPIASKGIYNEKEDKEGSDEKNSNSPSTSDSRGQFSIRGEIKELCFKLKPMWSNPEAKLEQGLDDEKFISEIIDKRKDGKVYFSSEEEIPYSGMFKK